MNPIRERFLLHESAGRAPLRRLESPGVRQVQSRTGLFRLVREHLMELSPASRQYFPVEPGLLPDVRAGFLDRSLGRYTHVLRRELFRCEKLALLDHARGELVMMIDALVRDLLMNRCDLPRELPPAARSLLVMGSFPLELPDPVERHSEPARILDHFAVIECDELFEAEIEAALFIIRPFPLTLLFGDSYRYRCEPFAVLISNREIVWFELGEPTQTASTNPADVRDIYTPEAIMLMPEFPSSRVGVCPALEPMATLETREARLLSRFAPPEEGGICTVEPPQGFLQGMAPKWLEVGPLDLYFGKLVLLIVIAYRDTSFPVRVSSLFEGGIIKLPMQIQPFVQDALLSRVRVQLKRNLASDHALIYHSSHGKATTESPRALRIPHILPHSFRDEVPEKGPHARHYRPAPGDLRRDLRSIWLRTHRNERRTRPCASPGRCLAQHRTIPAHQYAQDHLLARNPARVSPGTLPRILETSPLAPRILHPLGGRRSFGSPRTVHKKPEYHRRLTPPCSARMENAPLPGVFNAIKENLVHKIKSIKCVPEEAINCIINAFVSYSLHMRSY